MGEFKGKWVKYEHIVDKVNVQDRTETLQIQMIRFLIFFPLVVLNVTLTTNIHAEHAINTAVLDSLLKVEFMRPDTSVTDSLQYSGFMKYTDIHTKEEWWSWVEQVLTPTMFQEPAVLSNGKEAEHIAENNQVLWGVRIRQARVQPPSGDSCDLPEAIAGSGMISMSKCVLAYDENNKETAHFGGIMTEEFGSTQLYQYETITGGLSSGVFGEDGFVVDLVPLNKSSMIRKIRAMQCDKRKPVEIGPGKTYLWDDKLVNRSHCIPFLDERTSMISVVLQVYNPSVNVFSRFDFRVVFELSGANPTHWYMNAATLVQKLHVEGQVVFVDILLCLWMLIEFSAWVWECRLGTVNFLSPWTFLDLSIFGLSGIHIYDVISSVARVQETSLQSSLGNPSEFSDLHHDLNWAELVNIFQGLLIIALLFRVFKYLNFIKGLRAVFLTILRAGNDLIFFFLLFGIVILTFVFAGHIVFGPLTEEYHSISASLETILRMVLLDFNYESMAVAGTLGSLYFCVAMFFFYFLMVNIFTAIIITSWQIEKQRVDEEAKGEDPLGFIKWAIGFFIFFGWLKTLIRFLMNPSETMKSFKNWLDDRRTKMATREVLLRLEQWRARKQNRNVAWLDFERIQQVLAGSERNRRIVTDYQVQLVMRLCKTKRKGDDKLLFTAKERKALETEDSADGDDLGGPESNGVDSIIAMKKLVHAVGIIHNNQRAFWKDVNGSLQSIQGQVMTAQDRLHTINSVVNSMVPHVGYHHGSRGDEEELVDATA
jgi:hypothetical protein